MKYVLWRFNNAVAISTKKEEWSMGGGGGAYVEDQLANEKKIT